MLTLRAQLRWHPVGFTLVELLAVLVVLATISLTAAPALQRIESSRQSAARDEIARQLALARASALATGDPYGVQVDETNNAIWLVRIVSGGAPEAALDATGQPRTVFALASLYPGVSISSYVSGSGSPANDVVWFGYAAIPETRDASGASRAGFTQDAVITVSGGLTVTIRIQTGAIE